jgi:uncharacterized protein (TIGR03086 family)
MIERHRLATGREQDWADVITKHASHVEYQLKTAREPPMTNGPAGQLSLALDAARVNVAVRDEHRATPPPCTQWNVGGLVSHVVAGNSQFAAILRSALPAASSYYVGPGADLLSVHRDSARSLLTAVRQPGIRGRTVTVPLGPVLGSVALHLRIAETLVHGWAPGPQQARRHSASETSVRTTAASSERRSQQSTGPPPASAGL